MGQKRMAQTGTRLAAICVLAQATLAACESPKNPSATTASTTAQVATTRQPAPRTTSSKAKTETETASSASKATVLVSGLAGPTQIAFGPRGSWLVAELGGADPSGDENGSTGRILLIDPATKTQRVLATKLDKPTGVAWIDGTVWVMVRRGIVRFPLAEASLPDLMKSKEIPAIQNVVSDLPFNGRSEGTLTPLSNGAFLYETTGNVKTDATSGKALPEQGSGTLWSFDPTTKRSTPIAIGLKNSYAHVLLPDGRIVTTEIGDNISTEPLDEINILNPISTGKPATPQSFGWPFCSEVGVALEPADKATCDAALPAMRSFPPHVTPTGVARYKNDLYVSLFVSGQIVRLPNDAVAASTVTLEQRTPREVWAADLEGPHTLLVDKNRLLVTETTAGRIISFALDRG